MEFVSCFSFEHKSIRCSTCNNLHDDAGFHKRNTFNSVLCDDHLFRDLLDLMDPLARMEELVAMVLLVLLVLVDPLDTLDLL